jgi:thioredoxin 1
MEITLTNDNFKKEVLDSELPVLVDFWATWCGPCQMMGPVVAEIAEDKAGTLKVGKVNVDEQEQLASEFGVMSIPTFILFKNGKAAAQTVGGRSKEDLLKALGVA